MATDIPGVKEAMEGEKQGFLVPPGDSRRLAESIITLLEDKGLRKRMGNAGKERAEFFSIEKAVERTESLYDELIHQKLKAG